MAHVQGLLDDHLADAVDLATSQGVAYDASGGLCDHGAQADVVASCVAWHPCLEHA